MKENSAAAMQPQSIAGRIFLKGTVPWRWRNRVDMNADGRKNNKLMILASAYSMSATIVSQSISKLPPPTPNPARNPSTAAIEITTGKFSSINIEYLPIKS